MNPTGIVLSHYQARPLIAAHEQEMVTLKTTPDLGISVCDVVLGADSVLFPTGEQVSWEDLTHIVENPVSCFRITPAGLHKIQVFSEFTNRLYSLMPTTGPPTMLLSGIPMHRIKDIDPYQDTQLKIQAIKPVFGAVMDTTMGLGYTAIEAANTAAQVVTVELDPAVTDLARQNPWSRLLFENPKITHVTGDCSEVIETFPSGMFSRVIHDPPMFSLAGELYSGDFYHQLFRVMKNNSRLFHYIGDLRSSSGGRVARGAARRLYEAGFTNIKYAYQAFGLTAVKQSR